MNNSFCTAAWMPARNSSSDKTALLEKFVHQLVVGLGDVFDELAVQFLDFGLPFAGGRFFLIFAGTVRRVGDDFIAQHVQHLVETGPGDSPARSTERRAGQNAPAIA